MTRNRKSLLPLFSVANSLIERRREFIPSNIPPNLFDLFLIKPEIEFIIFQPLNLERRGWRRARKREEIKGSVEWERKGEQRHAVVKWLLGIAGRVEFVESSEIG